MKNRPIYRNCSLNPLKSSGISCILLLVSLASGSRAQSAPVPEDAASTTKVRVPRNGDSVEILSLALSALGGEDVWQGVRYASVEGSNTKPDGKAQAFSWTDRWFGKGHMERSYVSSSGESKGFVSDDDQIGQPQPDRVAQLLTYLPAAAILLALKDERYNLEPVLMPVRTRFRKCIALHRTRANLSFGGLQAVICFDLQTHLPAYAEFSVANYATAGAWTQQRIDYISYRTLDGRVVPKIVNVVSPNGTKSIVSFDRIEPSVQKPNGDNK